MPEKNDKLVVISITYWKNWYQRHVTRLQSKLIDEFGSNIMFDTNAVYVGGKPKPFRISLNDEVVYSKLYPLNGESTPLIIEKDGSVRKPKDYNRLIENINKLL